ncbi:uncharacterized protein LOC111624816 [Centruroides sculpturatus]|uniref:uncharacterized protein LOC111624816 n=1 Tax=Centruroides sculpturatus TaxID=218467 RepID=UPI000C6D6BA9|nr:uncharacterized protein LOC111624816 [Centruroides sculpturatus]
MMLRSKLSLFLIFCALFVIPTSSRYIKRSPSSEEEESQICQSTSPCGWEIYDPNTHRPEYFFPSPCHCADNLECVRDMDKPSISAYVHRCKSVDKNDSSNSIG